jgi:L-lactate dehydrogenase complex protein LldG
VPGEPRASFLARVRAALGRDETAPLATRVPEVDEALVRLASRDDDLSALFETRAREVGMHVHRTPDASVADVLLEILDAAGARRVAFSAGCEGEAAVAQSGREVVSGGLEALFEVDAGVTTVDAALAETGTLVLHAAAGHGRGLSLVPATHIALLRAGDIVPDMLDYWARPRPETSSRVFITGPSKTADIEGELIEGVHGPAVVHVILVVDR